VLRVYASLRPAWPNPGPGVRGGFDGKPTLLLLEVGYKKRGLGEMAAQLEEDSRASV
jgi:hypothetical protein